MFVLLLLWAALGLIVALVVRGARAWPAAFVAPRWRVLLAGGALAGLLGGWLGSLVFGRFYGAPIALWFSAVLLVAGPWVARNLTSRPPLPQIDGEAERLRGDATGVGTEA